VSFACSTSTKSHTAATMHATPNRTWSIKMISVMCFSSRFGDDLVVKLLDLFPDQFQDSFSLGRQPVILARPRAQERIKRAGADFIAVTPKFSGNPLAMNRLHAGMVQDMHLPKTQQDF